MGKTNKKEELNIPVMILSIVGVVLVVFGFLLLKNENFKLNVISTQGTVTGTTIRQTAEGEIESRTVNLSYFCLPMICTLYTVLGYSDIYKISSIF